MNSIQNITMKFLTNFSFNLPKQGINGHNLPPHYYTRGANFGKFFNSFVPCIPDLQKNILCLFPYLYLYPESAIVRAKEKYIIFNKIKVQEVYCKIPKLYKKFNIKIVSKITNNILIFEYISSTLKFLLD